MDNIVERVKKIVAEQLGVNEADIKNESAFVEDLGAVPVAAWAAGALYAFQVRAIGGSTGHSDWSDTRQHRSL